MIAPRKSHRQPRTDDKALDEPRHLVENAFLHFKRWWAIATRSAKNVASVVAAATFRQQRLAAHDPSQAYRTLAPNLGAGAATVFPLALLACGMSSNVVGTLTGQVVMQGLVGFTMPLWVLRLLTIHPIRRCCDGWGEW